VTDTAHVVPRGDLIDHDTNDGCPCGPTTEPVKRDDGSVGWVVTHHSIDGREAHEMTTDSTNNDRETLDTLPDDTLLLASGDYLTDGSFTDCWVRPVPEFVAGDVDPRLWEVLVFGATAPESLTDTAHIKAWRVLYTAAQESAR
jgi:hypothetical protein